MARRKRYALVGAGGRALSFVEAVVRRFADHCELSGLCDTNPARLDYYSRYVVEELGGRPVPVFDAGDFDAMVRQTHPDAVIVTTVDAFHHRYIVRAMELGCDVITEKPMTIDAPRCRAIMDAVRRTGRSLTVAFNYRWRPGCTLVRRLLQEGVIGEVVQVDMDYLLDTSHGADYFRRWHREKEKSGGLLVHKATHHFDLVNWWLDAVPETVFGMGRLAFYGRENAATRGVSVPYDRYTGHDTSSDPFALDLSGDERTRALYLEAEKYDGYRRDQNVFGDGVSIEDTMSLLVKYRTGVVLNYSLNAYLPREGFSVAFNGTRGRLEYQEAHGTDGGALGGLWADRLVVLPQFGEPYEVPVPSAEGGHGGADPLLQEQMFSAVGPAAGPLDAKRRGHGQGAASIMVGIAGNRSFETEMANPRASRSCAPSWGTQSRTPQRSKEAVPQPDRPFQQRTAQNHRDGRHEGRSQVRVEEPVDERPACDDDLLRQGSRRGPRAGPRWSGVIGMRRERLPPDQLLEPVQVEVGGVAQVDDGALLPLDLLHGLGDAARDIWRDR